MLGNNAFSKKIQLMCIIGNTLPTKSQNLLYLCIVIQGVESGRLQT